MHDLAEGKEHQKQVCKKHMEDKHKGMTRLDNTFRQLRSQIEKTGKICAVFFHGHFPIIVPVPCPVHLTSKKNGEKKENEQIIILRDRQIPVGGHQTPEEEKEK